MASPSSLDEETAKNVLRQAEFYFSDSNLPKDGFLTKTVNESEGGLVSLALICSFSRMKTHLGLAPDSKAEDISEDTLKAVAQTLKPSPFLKLSEDGKKVGRCFEIAKPEEVIEQVDSRTIAASPLEFDVKREDVESFFSTHGKVNSVRLPRHIADKKYFCGTGLIEFSSEEDVNNVLKQNLTYGGAELELKPKKDFDAEREKKTLELENSSVSTNNDDSTTGSKYPKGLIISFKLKHKPEEEPAEANGKEGGEPEEASVNDSEVKPMDDDNGVSAVGEAPELSAEAAARIAALEARLEALERGESGSAFAERIAKLEAQVEFLTHAQQRQDDRNTATDARLDEIDERIARNEETLRQHMQYLTYHEQLLARVLTYHEQQAALRQV